MKVYSAGLQDIERAKKVIDADLEQFISQWRTTFDEGSRDGMEAYCEIVLRGGKRLRGILAMQSYYAHGGQDGEVALGMARVLELVQAYLLVLDDIADRSATRRGGPSAHALIQKRSEDTQMRGDTAHYAEAQAVNAAQCGVHKAALELLALPVSDVVMRYSLVSLHKNIGITGIGQMNDIYNEATNDILDEVAIERVLTQKSAYYTFVNPLELGACLAGEEVLAENLHRYGLYTGCAFQITDDVIGTFGVSSETGKSTNDDIREGKMTLIAQRALTSASPEDRQLLRGILGDIGASGAQCDQVRQIMLRSGAKDYAQARGHWYATRALDALTEPSSLDPDFIRFLTQLVDYVTTRQS